MPVQHRLFLPTRLDENQPVRAEPTREQPASHGPHPTPAVFRPNTDGPPVVEASSRPGIPNGLRPNAANGARVARQLGFAGTIHGIGQRTGPSDHPHGNAIDLMTNRDRAQGRRLAEHFRHNHGQLGVKYVIFEQMIASPRTGWQWQRMADRGNPTANHLDHVHVSFY